MSNKHQCTNDCHKCLNCGKETFTPSAPARPKKFCDNTCQLKYHYSKGVGPKRLPKWVTKELMERMYIGEKKSVLSISKVLGKSPRQISRYLERFEIKARPFSTKGLKTWLGRKHSSETKDKIRQKALGRKIPPEVRRRMGSKGKKNAGYIDGRTPINKRIRRSVEYKLWRADVFERDNYTCQKCNKRGGDLHADHIKEFAEYPKLRFRVSNGRTLCKECHRKRHSIT